jgi:ABC-type transport system involved in multi-copper enzyme maturation permease subunit
VKIWALTRFTFIETARSKTMIAGLVTSLLYLAVVPMLSSTSGGTTIVGDIDQGAAARDFLSFSLGGLNFIAMIMAIFTTLGCIYTEVDKGTILAVVTKPIKRWEIVVGKWLGHVMMMSGYVLLMGMMLLVTVTLDSSTLVMEFFPAIGLICLNVIAMVSVTIAFSTFLPVVPNGIFAVLIFLTSSNVKILTEIGDTSGSAVFWVLANIFRLSMPIGEVSDLVTNMLETGNSAEQAFTPSTWIFVYEIAYIGLVVLIASWIFKERDLRQS